MDEKDRYRQIKLDKASSLLFTFNTPWGRFRFKCLPFGLILFQQKNSEAFGDISGVHVIADDMIIAAVDEKEHTEILHKVMVRAKELNIKFNADKIQYKVTKVSYMGHIVSAEGVLKEKVEAIVNIPLLKTKKADRDCWA